GASRSERGPGTGAAGARKEPGPRAINVFALLLGRAARAPYSPDRDPGCHLICWPHIRGTGPGHWSLREICAHNLSTAGRGRVCRGGAPGGRGGARGGALAGAFFLGAVRTGGRARAVLCFWL